MNHRRPRLSFFVRREKCNVCERPAKQRASQALLVVSLLVLSWYWMLVLHEVGHVLAAWSTGGTVTKVVLHPLAISRTDVEPNPHTLLVVWGGPLLGSLLPWIAWSSAFFGRLRIAYLLRFFAGFSLIANGAYIGGGSFAGVGDAGDMLRLGCPPWVLWVFGGVCLPIGIWLWNGLGPAFGFGRTGSQVNLRDAYWLVPFALLSCGLGAYFFPMG